MQFSALLSLYIKEKPEFLQQCLVSLAQQTLQATEIIIVYDGMITDELEQVVLTWLDKLPIKIIRLETNQGLGIALNEGLKHCQYQWVARMDTDDICVPERFASQVEFIQNNPNIDIVGGQIAEFNFDISEQNKKIKRVPLDNQSIYSYAKKRCPVNHMTVFFNKDKVLKVGGYQHALLYEDYYLWVRMLLNHYQFANIDQVLVLARTGNNMFQKRGGLQYAKSELKVQFRFYRMGFLSLWELIHNILIRIPIRLAPSSVRKLVYTSFLRDK